MDKTKAIENARSLVVDESGGSEKRLWLVGKAPDCYGEQDYSTEIHVLQGTPARGYVLVVGYHSGGDALAFGMYGRKKLGEFKYANPGFVVQHGCILTQ